MVRWYIRQQCRKRNGTKCSSTFIKLGQGFWIYSTSRLVARRLKIYSFSLEVYSSEWGCKVRIVGLKYSIFVQNILFYKVRQAIFNFISLAFFRLGFLWKYGGLYLDHDVLLVKPLLEDSSKQSNTKERHNVYSTNTTSDELGDNFIGFQSLNISHLIPDDTSTNLAKYFYPEDNYENSNTGEFFCNFW